MTFHSADSPTPNVRRSFVLFAVLLTALVGVFRLMLRSSMVLPDFVPELLGAGLMMVVGRELLRRANERLGVKSRIEQQPVAEQIIDQVVEGVLTINQTGQLVSMNPAAARLFGYRAQEIQNESITKILLEPPNENQKLFHDTISMGTVLGLAAGAREMTGLRKNGDTFPIEVVLSSMTLNDEQVTIALVRDVSKRKQAQRYLTAHYAATCVLAEANSLEEAQSEILQTICDSLRWDACAFWSLKPGTNELRCTEFLQAPNVAAHPTVDVTSLTCQLGQGLPGQVCSTGKPMWIEDLSSEQDFPCRALSTPCQLRTAFAFPIMLGEEVCGVIEVFSIRSLKPEPWLLSIMGEFGKQMGQFVARKRLEDRLRQGQKMEAVGQLAGGVAHDFNNLLTVIIGYSEILLGQSTPGDQTHDLLEQIQKAGERAASLTQQLLAFGRKQTLQVKTLNINSAVQDMTKMLRRIIGEDIEMVIHQEPHLGQVQADPVQIEQILMNLVTNARDAMPHGGRLTFMTTNIDLEQSEIRPGSELTPGAYVLLTVTDTGHGMDEATRLHAFEPFFTTKDIGKGTGLGLATVYGIIKQSNGHIELDSQAGHGTTFRIYLPRLAAEIARPQELVCSLDPRRGQETVLLVEDEDIVRRLTSHVLQASGYSILSASSGEEALALCREHQGDISLLVTDILMPQMNGVRLAELALKIRKDLKVLYMSGYTNNILENYGDFGASAAFLSKPASPKVLASKVREVLDAPTCKTAC